MSLTTEQMGKLLFKQRRGESRHNLKRYLHDCGTAGRAAELDEVLAQAKRSIDARRAADQLEREHLAKLERLEQKGMGGVVSMLADVQAVLDAKGMTRAQLAEATDTTPPQVSDYFAGKKAPGAVILARFADALGKRWRLVDVETKKPQ